jgi:hypothetical protein
MDKGHRHKGIIPQSFSSIAIGPEKKSVNQSQHSYHESEMRYNVISQKECDVNISFESKISYGIS